LKKKKELKSECLRRSGHRCIIGLFDGKNKEEMEKYAGMLKEKGYFVS